MPLSEHEQRLLEQIERALLAEDPKFASTVRATDPRHHARRRIVLAVLAFVAGIVLLLVGVASNVKPGGVPVIGVIGFVVMLAAAFWGVQSYRRAANVDPSQPVDVPSRSRGASSKGGRSTFFDRLEDRWRRRADGRDGSNGQQRG